MPNWEKIKKMGQERQDYIAGLVDKFADQAQDLAIWLDEAFADELAAIMQAGQSVDEKIRRINASKVFKNFYQKSVNVADWMVDKIKEIGKMLSDYFAELLGGGKRAQAENEANKQLERLGYKDGITPGGYFDNLINDKGLERRIKRLAIGAILSGKDFSTFRKELRQVFRGDKKAGKPGAVWAHYLTNASTAFSEFDRMTSFQMAEKNQLGWALWSGPRLATSRAFCISKKGKVFTKKQLMEMDAQEWQGKIPGQSTIISAGGYNCVDILLWITEEMANEFKNNNV